MAKKHTILVSESYGDTRVALLENRKIVMLEKESATNQINIGNIYTAIVMSFEPSLNAYFVNYNGNRPGFLSCKNISDHYHQNKDKSKTDQKGSNSGPLTIGQKILIQIERGERDNKGAAVTTNISIASCNLVIMPLSKKTGGISQKLSESSRQKLRDILIKLNQNQEDISVIIRTSGIERNISELEMDLNVLISYWNLIKKAAEESTEPCLIYRDNEIITRVIKDWIRDDVEKIIIDNQKTFLTFKKQLLLTKPKYEERVELHNSNVPLFTHYQIEDDIESIYAQKVVLTSGASIVIQQTEAMTTIDVNSARSTKGQDISETAVKTNLEAAPEIARQIKLRNIGGLIVVDFIDMSSSIDIEAIETKIAQHFAGDKAKIQMLKISKFALLEISRQRLYPSIHETELNACDKCNGSGTILSVESFASSILRKVEENSIHQQAPYIQVQLPIDVCTYLLNEKRLQLLSLEDRQGVTISIIPNKYYSIPQYTIKRIQTNSTDTTQTKHSYSVDVDNRNLKDIYAPKQHKAQKPLVDVTKHTTKTKKTSIIQRIIAKFFSGKGKAKTKKYTRPRKPGSYNSKTYYKNKPRSRHSDNYQNRSPNNRPAGNRQGTTGQLRTNKRNTTSEQEE
jgi:ribonuclease E